MNQKKSDISQIGDIDKIDLSYVVREENKVYLELVCAGYIDGESNMQKALFYAVYYFPQGVEADKANKECLIKLVPDAQFSIAQNPAHAQGGKYVVTVVDRCWNESKGSKVVEF